MEHKVMDSLYTREIDPSTVLSMRINERVALAKKKLEKEVLMQLGDDAHADARLHLAVVFQAMEDLYLNSTAATDNAMAVVYLYSSRIKELDEMGIETSWFQRILRKLQILDTHDPVPYVEACLLLQTEIRRPLSKGMANGLLKFIPICECVEAHVLDRMIDTKAVA